MPKTMFIVLYLPYRFIIHLSENIEKSDISASTPHTQQRKNHWKYRRCLEASEGLISTVRSPKEIDM